ncbi:MAG TPA: FoF1 ATP synthase subunit gamma [Mariprofundaceae bacterium]|nr:FoF1 ATP synthase subunit gamma [Mariprofundaceae bacterium]
MSKRHEAEHHLKALGEIRHIMGSMKTLAMLETRKLTRFLATQQQVVRDIEVMAADFRSFFPMAPVLPPGDARHVYLLLGSERGFCGDFNEMLLHTLDDRLRQDRVDDPLLVAVGRKLEARLAGDARLVVLIDGANVAEEVETVLGRLVHELGLLQERHGPFRLTVVYHAVEGDRVQVESLLPPFQQIEPAPSSGYEPGLNLAPDTFFAEMLDQYLFAGLYALVYTSLMAESRRRMQHLEGAINRLDKQVSALTLKRNTLRQEEITEEIEVILLSAKAVQQG